MTDRTPHTSDVDPDSIRRASITTSIEYPVMQAAYMALQRPSTFSNFATEAGMFRTMASGPNPSGNWRSYRNWQTSPLGPILSAQSPEELEAARGQIEDYASATGIDQMSPEVHLDPMNEAILAERRRLGAPDPEPVAPPVQVVTATPAAQPVPGPSVLDVLDGLLTETGEPELEPEDEVDSVVVNALMLLESNELNFRLAKAALDEFIPTTASENELALKLSKLVERQADVITQVLGALTDEQIELLSTMTPSDEALAALMDSTEE